MQAFKCHKEALLLRASCGGIKRAIYLKAVCVLPDHSGV